MPSFWHSLNPLFKPCSAAVIGASGTRGSVGNILVRNLIENPFGDCVYPVNPKRLTVQALLGRPRHHA